MNTKNKTKGLVIVAIIAFAATIFTGCVPTPGGGGTTPSGTFNVGLNLSVTSNLPVNEEIIREKTLLIDGDSITYKITGMYYASLEVFYPGSLYISCNNYENYEILGIKDFNVIINNQTEGFNNMLPINGMNQGYVNGERYFVFRKKKENNTFLYFWVKVLNQGFVGIIPSNYWGNDFVINRRELKILNGKYQMNSITTGL
jgi:hypothetical protein